ncbi:L-fuculose-phosphate aldolase [Sulfobacillus thermosulfidooxidans DSM 9293]|uniref:L-fuculose-phosphate aldolase n=1 Tax=Sulfobacillus thermosulfidooxidans (strain DSM 9293 / VKM B-1269 / AT-1) TaxID=929705 RepID=A0A1W1WB25_SULTA|nr:class II aldolase/adducin family protein [Sulfobacillus thermosulfidooxidans]SMC03501.1 L-fuculose-phosphate aldolase [Sulfobacillus thermosulfidooxidans DSM 9293]
MTAVNDLITYAHRMITDHLAFGTTGNLSVREKDVLWITPSGVPFEEVDRDNIVGVDIASGNVIEGHARPSSELPLHLTLYGRRPDIGAIVHTHSEYATIFAALGEPIVPIHYQMALSAYQVNCAEYATYGTEQLAHNALAALGPNDRAVLLKNHGLVAVGPKLSSAYQTALDVEWMARLLFRARCVGNPRVLTPEEVDHVREQFRHYGQNPQD